MPMPNMKSNYAISFTLARMAERFAATPREC
jgi:hypothetical protein